LQDSESPPAYWVNVPERAGWIVIHVNERPIGIVISITEAHQEFLQVAGYHLGETMFVGERKNILSIKVERIAAERYHEILPKIQEALPPELQGLPISFI
jgi:hypothetical protein